MKNTIKIKSPEIKGGRIDYSYEVSGDWQEAFVKEDFFIEYSCDISGVPESIAIIPLLCNILPMAWVYDADIYAESCDKAFFDSIPEFKKGYVEMFPKVNFGGNIYVDKIVENKYSGDEGAVTFFSGGVDAFNTLVNHADEKPVLLTVWGADVKFEDVKGWNNVENHIKKTSEDFEIEYVTIKSCFRRFCNPTALNKKVYDDATIGGMDFSMV